MPRQRDKQCSRKFVLRAVLNRRDAGEAMPAAVLLFSPWVDLSNTGDTAITLPEADPTLSYDGLLANAARQGEAIMQGLARELAGVPGLKEIRGRGLMIGVELDRPCGVILTRAAEAGLLLSVTADSVIRLVPPLIMTEAEADEVLSLLVPQVQKFLSE